MLDKLKRFISNLKPDKNDDTTANETNGIGGFDPNAVDNDRRRR